MLYIIYKTTNLLNNKFYIGKHQCLTLEDGYLGSGRALKEAVAKYGKENFKREILFIFNNEADMNLKEKELVTLDLVSDPNCYNLTVGGEGGPVFLGKHHSEQTKQLLHEKCSGKKMGPKSKEQLLKEREARYAKNGGKWFSEETINKLRQAALNNNISKSDKSKTKVIKRSKEEQNKARSEKLLGHEVSLETRKKLSEKNKGIKPSNTGKIQITNGIINKYILLEDFSKYEIEGWIRGNYKTKGKKRS